MQPMQARSCHPGLSGTYAVPGFYCLGGTLLFGWHLCGADGSGCLKGIFEGCAHVLKHNF